MVEVEFQPEMSWNWHDYIKHILIIPSDAFVAPYVIDGKFLVLHISEGLYDNFRLLIAIGIRYTRHPSALGIFAY